MASELAESMQICDELIGQLEAEATSKEEALLRCAQRVQKTAHAAAGALKEASRGL